jgi:hypothetical protein
MISCRPAKFSHLREVVLLGKLTCMGCMRLEEMRRDGTGTK